MSGGDTENTLKDKLMEILEEELSSLDIFRKQEENECLDDNASIEINAAAISDREEDFSESSDNAAEVLKENISIQNEEFRSEALSPPTESAAGDMQRQVNCQHQEIDKDLKEKIFNPASEKASDKYLTPASSDGSDKISNDDMESFIPPSDNLAEKILRRVEFYFEDYNILKNSFLLNHIKRNRKGYVSLKLVAALRKIKTLTKDFRVVAYSVKKSKVLEMNPECSKIRRIEPVPDIEDTRFGKTLMIFNLPHQNLSIDYLKELFSKFGTLVYAGIFGNNSKDRDAYHERCLYFHRRIASRIYGIVEFERYDQVVNALKDENGYLPKENEMKVVPLVPQVYKKEKRHLKFLEHYNPSQRQGYRGFRPRDEARTFHSEMPAMSRDIKNGRMNTAAYQDNRGNFRRPFRGRKYYAFPNTKNFWDGQVTNDYNGTQRRKLGENRELKTNNCYNIH